MESHVVDGNNMLEVYHLIKELKASMIENPRPKNYPDISADLLDLRTLQPLDRVC